VSYEHGESSFLNLFIKAPLRKKFRVDYEKIKIEACKELEIRMNLGFAY